MHRSALRKSILAIAILFVTAVSTLMAQDNDKSFDVRSSVGDMHLGKDADAKAAGFPLYPGARIKVEKNNDPLNFGIFTEAFGFKIVVVKYESDDPPAKVLDFYRDKLKKYGKVLECHGASDDGGIDLNDDDKNKSKELKCEGDNKGPVNELKVGSQNNQHIVAIESPENQKGSTFALVYLYGHGKQGDI
ncbi:MAG: hypothetical protein ACLQLC_00845 [Candidatus Sulfotelmatobacter sp.]